MELFYVNLTIILILIKKTDSNKKVYQATGVSSVNITEKTQHNPQ